MGLKKVAELSVAKLEDRKAIASILAENNYVVGFGKRKKTQTGKTMDYFVEIYCKEGILNE